MIMNYENGKRALEEETEKGAEMYKSLTEEIAKKKTEIEDIVIVMITLQDLMRDAQMQKETLERECAMLENEYNKKKSITEAIGKIFKTEKTTNPTVETISNTDNTMNFTQKVTSSLNKLRYDYRKGAITEEEFKEGVNSLLKESIDDELNK